MKRFDAFQTFSRVLLLSAAASTIAGNAVAAPPPATFWTGPTTNYTQTVTVLADTLVPGKVSLCRGTKSPLFNPAAGESGSDLSTSPKDTEWFVGQNIDTNNPSAVTNLSYVSFSSLRNNAGGNLSAYILAHPKMVAHLINENIYLSVTFTSWHQGSHNTNNPGFASGFSYVRGTPAAVVVGPALGISSPVNGATFVTPATVPITATVTNGTSPITNVAFFANGSISLGSKTNAPFTVTANALAPGAYALTAVATAGGVNATSAVVNITVIVPPTVGVSSPTNGSVFAAPANVPIAASVTNGTSSVTNVAFFAGTTSLGSTNGAPFQILATNLSAGAYALTAVATAGGISATSSVVNISVINPVVVSNSPPQIGNGTFSFNFAADTGLRYVVQSSSNLVDWISVATNTASGGSVPFSDTVVSNENRYYRVARLPNP